MAGNFDIETVPQLLIQRLRSLNPQFELTAFLDKFRELKTNSERVNFAYKVLKKYRLLPKLQKDGKNDGEAIELRELGNCCFQAGDFADASKFYTHSIMSAKSKSVLALAYGNRSASLFRLGLYKECLTDIERAFANNYPSHLKHKLINRRLQVEQLMPQPDERYHEKTPEISVSRKNPLIQSAKKSVTIQRNEQFGTNVVATKHIQIGEIISVEKPFASTMIEESGTHCHYCMEICYNLIPCENCTCAAFCSENCKQEAQGKYHQYECCIHYSLLTCQINPIYRMALRVAILARADYNHLQDLKLKEEEEYRSDRYKEIHNLKAFTENRRVEDLFVQALTAAYIFHLLLNTTIFNSYSQNTKENFKEILLLQLQICSLNELGITELFEMERHNFAVGLYAFSSLFNHSCRPNVALYSYGSKVVARAINTIKKDQQCLISYGTTYNVMPREIRQEYLSKQYFFNCNCIACQEDWMLSNNAQAPFSLCRSLEMGPVEIFVVASELCAGSVETAKYYLPLFTLKLKQSERLEPFSDAVRIKELVGLCFGVLANKRKI